MKQMSQVGTEVYERNLKSVEADIENACTVSGRSRKEIMLVAVTKTVSPEVIPQFMSLGIRDFAENRWQVAKEKFTIPDASEAMWHFIGTLQINKVKYVVPKFSWIHSVDSLALGQAIHNQALKLGVKPNILVQVNISGEEQKHGIRPEDAQNLVRDLSQLSGLCVRGLMTMAPDYHDVEETRSVFRGLRELLSQLQKEFNSEVLNQLSMGMSNDFSVAIQEGATMVRIGRRLMQSSC